MSKVIFFFISLTLTFALGGCNSSDENDAIAKAQKCLDEATVPSDADSCLEYVEKYTSQQAQILKCSILHTSGGLMEDKIIKGYNVFNDSTITNKETAFMAILTLDNPSLSAGLTKAQSADVYCQATGVPGLKYLSSIIVAGTAIASTVSSISGGTTIGINSSSTDINNAVTNLLNTCAIPNPTDTACDDNLATIGTAVASLSASYCASDSADDGVCTKINEAVTAAGNNATNIGQALLCYLKNKTYNSSTGDCNP